MATNEEKVFHDGIEFSLAKLGNPNVELKKEQYDAIRVICLEKRDILTVLPTVFANRSVIKCCLEFLILCKVKLSRSYNRLDSHRCVSVKCTDPGSLPEVKRLCECLCVAKYRGR